MYLQHYGFKRFPFDITSDPDFLWTGEDHRNALELLREGVFQNRGFVVLTGEVGTGKTTLINTFRRLDDIATIIVTIPDPDMEVLDFFNFLAHEFGIENSFANIDEFVHLFKNFLLRAYATYKKVLVIIDEAQRLNSELLAEIAELAKIELAGRRLLKIFFVGQLEFNKILMQEGNKSILDEVVSAQRLNPLVESDIPRYIKHRLEAAGIKRGLFDPQAIQAIYRSTRGLPRSINVLCDQALLTGFLSKNSSIDKDIIHRSIDKIQLPSQHESEPVEDLPTSSELSNPVLYKPVKQIEPWAIIGLVCLILILIALCGFLVFNNPVVLATLRRAISVFIEMVTVFFPN